MYRTLTVVLTCLLLVACGSEDNSPTDLETGAACAADEECLGGICLEEIGNPDIGTLTFADGMCTNECSFEDELSCLEESEICLRYNPTKESFCFPTCSSEEQFDPTACRVGYNCVCLDDPLLCFLDSGRYFACIPEQPSFSGGSVNFSTH